MLRKWKVIAPLALTAAGALASGVAILICHSDAEAAEGHGARR